MVDANLALVEAGYNWASENINLRVNIPIKPKTEQYVVMNGNQAIAMGAIASGMELAAMYPITPASSVSHHLGSVFESFGGVAWASDSGIDDDRDSGLVDYDFDLAPGFDPLIGADRCPEGHYRCRADILQWIAGCPLFATNPGWRTGRGTVRAGRLPRGNPPDTAGARTTIPVQRFA